MERLPMNDFKDNLSGESTLLGLSVLVLALIIAIFFVVLCIHEYTNLVNVDWI